MQIMPATAEKLGVNAADVFDPETNIEASARYIKQLNHQFSDIPGSSVRIPFVLAAYNGGTNHVRDAMALARKNGKNASYVFSLGDNVWRNPYFLYYKHN